jgi:hypothetical protein
MAVIGSIAERPVSAEDLGNSDQMPFIVCFFEVDAALGEQRNYVCSRLRVLTDLDARERAASSNRHWQQELVL